MPASYTQFLRRHGSLVLFLLGVLILAGVVTMVKLHQDTLPRGGRVALAGPIDLIDVEGRPVHASDLRGKPSAVFFGFTYCPEVCPTTLAAVSAAMKSLGPDVSKLNVVFVTVDPQRDDPAHLKAYLASFDPRIRGLTGSVVDVRQAAASYGIYYRKIAEPNGGYTVDHSSSILLFDASGRFTGLIPFGASPEEIARKLRSLIASSLRA